MDQDKRLYVSLWKQVGQFETGKLKLKSFTPLGLPYLFKRNQVSGKAWTHGMPQTCVTVQNEWVEDGMTPEQDCALWIDHFFSQHHPVGYYGA